MTHLMCHPPSLSPISKICRYDGAHSGTVVKVRCTGIGYNHATAEIDAKKAASWYVVSRILSTPYERERFSTISNSFYKRYNTFVGKFDTDGTIQQNDSGQSQIEASMEVNRQQIIAFLTDNGIVNPQRTMEKIGNPTVAVYAKWKTHHDAWDPWVRNAANEYLTSRKYNAIDLASGMKKLQGLAQRVLRIDGVPGDEKNRAAMVMGADVFIEIVAHNEGENTPHVRGIASIKAYETTTARLLGSSSAVGRRYPRRETGSEFTTVKEAIQNATDNVLEHVMSYWKDDVSKGNRYFVMLAGNLNKVEDMGDHINLKLRGFPEFAEVQCPTITEHRMMCTFRSKKDLPYVRLNARSVIGSAPGVSSIYRSIATRKFFLFLINHKTATAGGNPDELPPGM